MQRVMFIDDLMESVALKLPIDEKITLGMTSIISPCSMIEMA